ncbi:hypothetical protein GT347_01160 [Xylophilus rhododendri]|uniref:Patatin-like phospholipase n=1 Tax=Xylophilus rhododendri TaxID=2697032 RepID=A0A857IYR9_9BURK|nr:patatin-like phospholipase family protein [Xylophilus rhododendri]QHI96720.1 hypothetical protein GT347_01160 [Xylophilus rhododendri]
MPEEHGPESSNSLSDMQRLCEQRRQQLADGGAHLAGQPTWGLALSGGGIRSATFCFGLLKALAQKGIFHRFDLLSTVSGGGYIGSTIGKLFQTAVPGPGAAGQVEQALAEADKKWFSFWLRANGRYLIPNGATDLFFAAANFGRNLLGIHIEIALLGILAGCLLALFDTAVWQCADGIYAGRSCFLSPLMPASSLPGLSRWPTLWLLLIPLGWLAGVVAVGYWALPAQGQRMKPWRWLEAAAAAALAWLLASNLQARAGAAAALPGESDKLGLSTLTLWLVLAVLSWSVLGTLLAWAMAMSARPADMLRNRLTGWLAWLLKWGIVVAAVGLMDVLAWVMARAGFEDHGVVGGGLALAVVAARALLPRLADLPKGLTPGIRLSFMAVINLVGLAVLVALLVFWISVVHRNASTAMFQRMPQGLTFAASWKWLAVFFLPPALIVGFSWRNREFLNRSSLFSFYRARLIRSYLGAGNVRRFQKGVASPLEGYPRDLAPDAVNVAVQQVEQGDDEAMSRYEPHRAGGPVHLLNVCVNQTRDPRGGLFNQDRKGLPMTVGPRGQVRVGQERWREVDAAGSMTLGSWMAISGAAVAPGLGASTRSGLSALLMLGGVRLGYWWDSCCVARGPGQARPRAVGKYGQLLAELQGRFDGVERRDWYLSDGGHFENTGAYALLREECGLIVVADCGADPRYSFGDLENLVRKARIDLQTEIRFLKPNASAASGSFALEHWSEDAAAVQKGLGQGEIKRMLHSFGSLNDLVSEQSHACLALAQVRYGISGTVGWMVVVKPNICEGLPVDLVNFKADKPLFPQEPTTDQFFSESQWESYFQLGNSLGRQLDGRFLANIGVFARAFFEEDDGTVTALDARGQPQRAAAPKRLPSRIAATGAVTASVGLGAILTLAATAWQATSAYLDKQERASTIDAAVLKEVSDLYASPAKLAASPASPAAAATDDPGAVVLATALLRIDESVCKPANRAAFQASNLVQLALASAKERCASTGLLHPSCKVLVTGDGRPSCVDADDPHRKGNCQPQYWIRSFDPQASALDNCVPVPGVAAGVASTGWAYWFSLDFLGMAWPPGLLAVLDDAAHLRLAGLEWWPDLRSALVNDKVASTAHFGGAGRAPGLVPAPPPSGATAEAPAATRVCGGKTIYIQIFGPELRGVIDTLYRKPLTDGGARVPAAEDVLDSARRNRSQPPRMPSRPTAIYHDRDSMACAASFQGLGDRADWDVRALPESLAATPGVVEIWLPAASGATAENLQSSEGLPGRPFCYQEFDPAAAGPRYGVHCHATAARCEKARGPNPKTRQSACVAIDSTAMGSLAPVDRGWAGSWYRRQATAFGAPFPPLPQPPSGN